MSSRMAGATDATVMRRMTTTVRLSAGSPELILIPTSGMPPEPDEAPEPAELAEEEGLGTGAGFGAVAGAAAGIGLADGTGAT
jgi:hypothetical protein